MDIRFNSPAFVAILNSPGVIAELNARAARIADAANATMAEGEGYMAMPAERGAKRARVAVITATAHAMNHEAMYHSLVSSIDAGR